MRRGARAVLALALGAPAALAGCPKAGPEARATPVGDPFSAESSDETPVLEQELQTEVLESYQHDETIAGDDWLGTLDPGLGVIRIGVGPRDEAVTHGGTTPPRHLPLGLHPGVDDVDNPACPTTLRSKDLRLHLSPDGGSAWITDEPTLCISVCGKQALLPLRLSAVYVRGGDRWVLAAEHLSYPQPAGDVIARGDETARPLDAAVAARSYGTVLRQMVADAVAATKPADRAHYFASSADAMAWWPDPAHELRGDAVVNGPSLTDAFDATRVEAEAARIGLGPSAGAGQGKLAWWAGTILVRARKEAGDGAVHEVPVRLRATFVLEQVGGRWRIVQSHVSAPIDDARLAKEVAGDATMVGGQLVVPCEAPRPAPPPVAPVERAPVRARIGARAPVAGAKAGTAPPAAKDGGASPAPGP